MTTRMFGEPIRRREDPRLLRGRALFVDDVELPGMLHVAFVRSPFAHARIRAIDSGVASRRRGVVAVVTAQDLGAACRPGPVLVPPPPIPGVRFEARTQSPLAGNKVYHSGEPVAAIVAESRYLAEDARDDVVVDYEPLPVVVDLERALAADSPLVHEDLVSNQAAWARQTTGDYEAARRDAAVLVARRFRYDRGTAAAMENRGIVASWDERAQELTVWDTTQAPIPLRGLLAVWLGLPESQVRVIAPFLGGGFGPKIMMPYPDEIVVPWLARRLGRPIKWIEDREENFFSTSQERLQIHDAEIALTRDGTILGVRDRFLHDTGAFSSYGLTVPINSQCTLLGCYRVPSYDSEFQVVFTNTPLVTPYRGAGRQHGMFVMERLLDFAAHELALDEVEIRRRNLLQPADFPYRRGLIFQDFTELSYDSGDYEPCLNDAAAAIGWPETRPATTGKRHRGLGLVTYVEGTGIGPYEGARITVEASGHVSVATGVGTQGQGHFTSFAQLVAQQLAVPIDKIRVTTGDTKEFHWGTGTFASRGAVVAGNAIHAAAVEVRRKALELASRELEAAVEDLELVDSQVQVRGAPGRGIALGELAQRANPLRGAVEPGSEPGLEATRYFGPEGGATANGVHALEVEVDLDTFQVEITRYVVVHDCGRVINPMILEGQIVGGVAQGIGNAFFEQLHFDEEGQLRNASLMDYLLPTSLDVPRIETHHRETPSPLNPLGIKGAGEAGAIPVAAAFAQAVERALRSSGDPALANFEIHEIPLSPQRLFELVQAAREAFGAGVVEGEVT